MDPLLGAGLLLTVAAGVHGAPPLGGLLLGLVAGAVAGLGLLLYYGALARGPISVVSPLAASGVAVPVLVGTVTGQAPGPLGWAGLVAAGVLVIARNHPAHHEPAPPCPGGRPGCPDEQGRPRPAASAGPRRAAGRAGFGLTLVLIGACGQNGSPLWVAAGLQSGGLLALIPVLLAGPRKCWRS